MVLNENTAENRSSDHDKFLKGIHETNTVPEEGTNDIQHHQTGGPQSQLDDHQGF